MVKEILCSPEDSAKNKMWILNQASATHVRQLQSGWELKELTSQVLINRDVGFEYLDKFLSAKIKDNLPNPFTLKDMDIFCKYLSSALSNGQSIGILGDYDVDGATSSALLKNYFRQIGITSEIYIPDRIEEGYGPNTNAFDYFKSRNIKTVVTVDCGTMANDEIAYANNLQIDVLVLDHHECNLDLPKAKALVNPRRFDDESDLQYLAAVGVTFLAVVALNKTLRDDNYFTNNNIKEPNLISFLDLVALGTVCDMVPIVKLNRAFVKQGLGVLKASNNVGLRQLMEVSSLEEEPKSWHLAFILGPKINAGGRVGQSYLGAQLLSTQSFDDACKLAEQLYELNKQRQEIEQDILSQAEAMLENIDESEPIILLGREDWHPGVLGIIASKVKENHNKPSLIWCENEDGDIVGSARSISQFDLGNMVLSAVEKNILIKGGGHHQAAGFTVGKENLKQFKEFAISFYHENITEDPVAEISLDALVSLDAISLNLIEDIGKLEPYGVGFSEPKVAVIADKVLDIRYFGQDNSHIRLTLQSNSKKKIVALAFRAGSSNLPQYLQEHANGPIMVAGSLKINNWNGRSYPQIFIEDIAKYAG